MEVMTQTERGLAALTLAILDHLDECPICREDGVRWCPELQDLQSSLRFERILLVAGYHEQ
jgi:hypothetical protein